MLHVVWSHQSWRLLRDTEIEESAEKLRGSHCALAGMCLGGRAASITLAPKSENFIL